MLKVKIESITGFGKTAEFATIHLMNYDLASGAASAMVNLYENDPSPSVPSAAAMGVQIMSKHINCTSEDTLVWGTDDLVFVDLVLAKAGLVRDTEWVAPTTTMMPMPTMPTTTEAPVETTTTTEAPVETTTTTEAPVETTTTTEAPVETTTTTEAPGE